MGEKCKNWIRCIGITFQGITYLSNAFIWAVSILAVICGFVIGIANDTIRINTPKDLGVTTPATILIIYGFLMIIVTSVGCFSSVTAGSIISLLYILLIIGYICFDAFGGYSFLFSDEGFITYYGQVNASLTKYGREDNMTRIGIFPISPEAFWDHLQTRGKCCGFMSSEDWKKTPFSRKTFNIPDSCCNDVYNHRFCGLLVFQHPDTEHHSVDHMVHTMGCNDIFPEPMRYPPEDSLTYVGRFVGCLILICCILTFVIFVMIATNLFRKDQGIDNLDYVQEPKDEEEGVVVMNGSGEQHGQIIPSQKSGKVHPETIRTMRSDEEDESEYDYDPNSNKRVVFRESGPQFIHDVNRPHSAPSQDTRIRERSNNNNNNYYAVRRPKTDPQPGLRSH